MVIYTAKEKKAHALDFREKAPKAVGADLYSRKGRLVPELSRRGALAVAVPGEVAGLTEALKRFGSLPLETVISPLLFKRYFRANLVLRSAGLPDRS